jgi:hypothetical protein
MATERKWKPGTPVTFKVSGVRYEGVFECISQPGQATIRITRVGETEMHNLTMLVGSNIIEDLGEGEEQVDKHFTRPSGRRRTNRDSPYFVR